MIIRRPKWTESSLQNWNAFTRPKEKNNLIFFWLPHTVALARLLLQSTLGEQCSETLLRSSPHPTDITDIAPPSTTRLRSLGSGRAGLTSAGLEAAGPDGCLLGRIHFPCGYVCLWFMCFCVAEVFFLFSHCTPQGA